MGVKFGTEEGTECPLLRAKFHPHRCNVSPLRGEKPQNWPLSKLNTGRFALRAMLPVTNQTSSEQVQNMNWFCEQNRTSAGVAKIWCEGEGTKLYENYKCEPIPNVVAALPNVGGALCSMPQSLADADYSRAVTLPSSGNLVGCPKLVNRS